MRSRRGVSGQSFQGLLMVFVLVLSAVVLLGIALARAQSAGDPVSNKETELQELRHQIQEHRQRAKDLSTDEKNQVARLDALEKEAAATVKLLRQLDARRADFEGEVSQLEREIGEYEASIERHRERLAASLRQMYIRGRHRPMTWLFSSDDLGQLSARVKLMSHVARGEQGVIDEVQRSQRELTERRARLSESLSDVYRTQSEAQDRRTNLDGLSEERRQTLQGLRQQREGYEASARELEQAAAEMENIIVELERRRQERQSSPVSTGFVQRKGELEWPLNGKVTQGFGRSVHPKFKTVVMNKGLNIASPTGTPIQVVHGGSVEYVNWLPGYGKCIIVNHGDGYYTLYAHASMIFIGTGERVEAGQVIAEVGDTGSLNGSQLYFEIRKGKDPVDPGPWLRRSR